jgi:hypothetical protein
MTTKPDVKWEAWFRGECIGVLWMPAGADVEQVRATFTGMPLGFYACRAEGAGKVIPCGVCGRLNDARSMVRFHHRWLGGCCAKESTEEVIE